MHKFYVKKLRDSPRLIKLPLAALATLITIRRNLSMIGEGEEWPLGWRQWLIAARTTPQEPRLETGWRDWLFVVGMLRIQSGAELPRSTAVILAKGYYVEQVITLFMAVKRLNISLGRDIRMLIFKETTAFL